jgi:hypothetical protein
MLGRVMALYNIAFLGTTPIGALLVGWLASSFNARAPFLAGGTVVALTSAAMLALASRARVSPTGQEAHVAPAF